MITARYWREIPQRYRFEAGRCTECGAICFPPRLICPVCKARTFEAVHIADEGVIETFTVIRVAPTGFGDEVPFAVAVIKLADGVKITAQVVDCDVNKLEIGARVRAEFRRLNADRDDGVIFYGYKFVPAQPWA